MRRIANDRRTFALVAVAAGILVAVVTAVSQTHKGTEMDSKYSETESANLKKVNEGFDAWKDGTGSPYQLLEDNVSWTIVGNSLASKQHKGRKAGFDIY